MALGGATVAGSDLDVNEERAGGQAGAINLPQGNMSVTWEYREGQLFNIPQQG